MAEQVLWTGDHLKLQIGLQVLFKDTFFSIHSGERVALVGRNGCGKSTLMKVIAGLESVSEGVITSMRDLRIAYMPQDFTLSPGSTVRETIREGAAFLLEKLEAYKHLPTADGSQHRLQPKGYHHRTSASGRQAIDAIPGQCTDTTTILSENNPKGD